MRKPGATIGAAEFDSLARRLLTAYYPGALDGRAPAKHFAFVLDAKDAYVTSGATDGDLRLTAVRAGDLTSFGLGIIGGSVIRSSTASYYRAGQMGADALDVYIIRLNTTSPR